jgi:FkbM family methyltransferase
MAIASYLTDSRKSLEACSRSRQSAVPYGDGKVLCHVLGDYLMMVGVDDLIIGPRLALDGFWEPWVSLVVGRYLSPGMRCVDVGANYGYYSILMRSGCGSSGYVLACEPNPIMTKKYLPNNFYLNGFFNGVEISELAIIDREDTVEFVVSNSFSGSSGLKQFNEALDGDSYRVRGTTLDNLVLDWPRLDLVKIDVEGADLLVWNGMQTSLRRFSNVVVILEVHLGNPDQSRELLSSITDNKYLLQYINYDGDIKRVEAKKILDNPNEHWALWIQK